MRIRTIKPEFWVSESVGRLSRDARLLFIALWNFADDSGRSRGAFPAISGALFPYDPDAMKRLPGWFEELEREGMVRRYTAEDGNSYFDIPNWLKHQKIEKPSASKFPPFTESSPKPPRLFTEGSPLEQGTGNREQGPMEQGKGPGVAGAPVSANGRFKPPSREELDFEAAKAGLPAAEVDKFFAYYTSNGWRVGKNPMKSWPHSLAGWAARWRERNETNAGRDRRGNGANGNPRNDGIAGFDEWERERQARAVGDGQDGPPS